MRRWLRGVERNRLRRVWMMGESFDSVLAAARLGADWAWRVLYEDTAPGLRAYLSFRGADDPDGLVGDVFLAAAKGIGSFEGSEEGFRSWLFSIAHARLGGRAPHARSTPYRSGGFLRVRRHS
ncbi:MAG: hypothetical protein V3S26_03410, partial [Acidimicrobiia bacterium]